MSNNAARFRGRERRSFSEFCSPDSLSARLALPFFCSACTLLENLLFSLLSRSLSPPGSAFLKTPNPPLPTPQQARRAAVSAVTVASGEPTGPVLRKPEAGSSTGAPSTSAPSSPGGAPSPSGSSSNVTVEFQRSQAKAMQAYFRALKADQVAKDNQRFGWTRKNEILNGRHVMGGIFVGLLTEYSTGVNFIDQLKLTVSLLGIADIYD